MPVRLKIVQSDWSIGRWSPTTSATITPAYCWPGNAARMRSRSVARQCSTRFPVLNTEAVEAPIVGARGPHVACRAHALFELPYLVIEAVGIGAAVRSLQAHRQLPAFAGLHEADWLDLVAESAVPRERHPRRHFDRRAHHLFGPDPIFSALETSPQAPARSPIAVSTPS